MAVAQLSGYPSPLFVEEGVFDGSIVVGDEGKASDVVGAVDIAAGIQAETFVDQMDETMRAGRVGVTTPGDPLHYNEELSNTISTLVSDDIESLQDEEIAGYSYSQFFSLPEDVNQEGEDMPWASRVNFLIDDDVDDDPQLYLSFSEASKTYEYSLVFTEALESDIDDESIDRLEDRKITMLGNEYTITEALADEDSITLEMMGGATFAVQDEYTTQSYTVDGEDYEVRVVAISTLPSVVFNVNGETTSELETGETYRLDDGTEIGVRTLIENEGTEAGGSDIVQFYIGASKVTMTETATDDWATESPVGQDAESSSIFQYQDDDVPGMLVDFSGTSGTDEIQLSRIDISWFAQEDYNVPEGDRLSDYVEEPLLFETVDFGFKGPESRTYESLEFSGDNELVTVETAFRQTDSFTFDALYTDGNDIMFGEDDDRRIVPVQIEGGSQAEVTVDEEDMVLLSEDSTSRLVTVEDIEDDRVIFVDEARNSEVSVAVQDGEDGELLLSGNSFTFTNDYANGQVVFEGLGDDYTERIGMLEDDGSILFYTGNQMLVVIHSSGTIELYEESQSEIDNADYEDGISAEVSIQGDELHIDSVEAIQNTQGYVFDQASWETDEDLIEGRTSYGTRTEHETDDEGRLLVRYPSQQVVYNVDVMIGPQVVSEERIPQRRSDVVGAARLSSEIEEIDRDLIVVGGPCVNSIASSLLDDPEPCTTGFQQGIGRIQYFREGGNDILLVAGLDAIDTRRAAWVLANYQDYELTGEQALVEGTGPEVSDVRVSDQASSRALECLAEGGTWREFPDACVDSCSAARDGLACAQVLTMGCDCGEGMCWNGESCVDI